MIKTPTEHAYSASKGGVMALMKVMALDYAEQNIRVNAVIPGRGILAARRRKGRTRLAA